jgi:general secretion pathway protein A
LPLLAIAHDRPSLLTMYTQFFHLKQAPFSLAPDPRYLFMSERHREALAHLLYGVGSGGGFVLLTGDIGAGKTTVCRCFLEQIPENCRVAYIFNPKLSVEELLRSICDEFGLVAEEASAHSIKTYVDLLNAYLLASHAKGRNNVLIIDEAQNLSPAVLEQLRLLTNLETNERKLLQIILIGQPELRSILAQPELEQLAQRVIARYHLGPLSIAETGRYILHRLGVAGLGSVSPIPSNLMQQIQRLTAGVPRRINLLCDRALLGAYAENKHQVDRGVMQKAAQEVFGKELATPAVGVRPWHFILLGLLLGVLVTAAIAWRLLKTGAQDQPTPPNRAHASAATPKAAGSASATALAEPAATPIASPTAPDTSPNPNLAANAYRELAQLWGLTLTDAAPCQAAFKKNLRCYASDGGLAELLQLNRPAVLTMRDDVNTNGNTNSNTYYALLVQLDKDNALLHIDGKPEKMSLATLATKFQGEFTTFWRVPRLFREVVAIGNRGADVDWIAGQLAAINGLKKPTANQTFDQQLSAQVRAFQASQKLKIDATVGPRTYMRLNHASGINEPRLMPDTAPATAMPPQ